MAENFIPARNMTPENLKTLPEVNKFYLEEERPLLRLLNTLKANQARYNFTLRYVKDLKVLQNPNEFSYIPVYQEGFATESISTARGLVTWGVQDCVVIAAYNEFEGTYLTHTLRFNSFSKNSTSASENNNLSGINRNVTCPGVPIQTSLPNWIHDDHTQVFLFSFSPITLLNRIKQLRTTYKGPITAYFGYSWDGTTGFIRGYSKNTTRNMRTILNDRNPSGSTVFGITPNGFFGIIYTQVSEAPDYLKTYMNEIQTNIEETKIKNSRKKKISNMNRRCVYESPPPLKSESTPPPSPILQSQQKRPQENSLQNNNPFLLLANGGTRRKRRQSRKLKRRS